MVHAEQVEIKKWDCSGIFSQSLLSLAELSSWQSFVQTFLLFIFLRFNRFLSHFLSNISHKIVAVALFPVARSRYFRCFICLCKFNVSSDHFTIAWSLFLSLRVFLSRQSCFYLAKFKKMVMLR